MHIDSLVAKIGLEWLDILLHPDLNELFDDPIAFAQSHNEIIQSHAQKSFGALSTLESVREAAELAMNMALFFAPMLGADAKGLSEHWIEIAKSNGAVDH